MKQVLLLLTLFICSLSASLNAQWTDDTAVNTLVAESPIDDLQSIGTSDGNTYVVYWKSVPGPTNFELRMQVLDADGNQQLGEDGALISDSIPMRTFTVTYTVAVDADDNLYVGATGTDGDIAYAFKMDQNGNHLWGDNGVRVGEGFSVTILPLASGEAIVTWFAFGPGLMQKYDADGNALWADPLPIDESLGATVPADLYEMANGDYVMVFHSITFRINSLLYTQRYSPEGIAQRDTSTQISDQPTFWNRIYNGTQDGDNVYFSYAGRANNRFDAYIQRINPDGTLPWGLNGVDYDVNMTNFESDIKVATSPASNDIWAICRYTDPNQSLIGEYAQRVNKESGERQLSDTAKVIFPVDAESDQHASDLYVVKDQFFFLEQNGTNNGVAPTTLNAVLLDANGDFVWAEETKPVATDTTGKHESSRILAMTIN